MKYGQPSRLQLVLLGLLAKFAWGPLLQALEARQESIRRSLDDAQQAKAELERLQRITRLPVMSLKKDMRSEVEGAMTAEITLTIYFEGDAAQARSRT